MTAGIYPLRPPAPPAGAAAGSPVPDGAGSLAAAARCLRLLAACADSTARRDLPAATEAAAQASEQAGYAFPPGTPEAAALRVLADGALARIRQRAS